MPEGAAPSTRGGAGRGARVPTPRVVERLGCFAGAGVAGAGFAGSGFAGSGSAGAGLAGRGGATAGSAAPSLTVGRGGGRLGAVVEAVSGVLWAGATPSIVDRVVRGGGGRPAPPDEALPSEAPTRTPRGAPGARRPGAGRSAALGAVRPRAAPSTGAPSGAGAVT